MSSDEINFFLQPDFDSESEMVGIFTNFSPNSQSDIVSDYDMRFLANFDMASTLLQNSEDNLNLPDLPANLEARTNSLINYGTISNSSPSYEDNLISSDILETMTSSSQDPVPLEETNSFLQPDLDAEHEMIGILQNSSSNLQPDSSNSSPIFEYSSNLEELELINIDPDDNSSANTDLFSSSSHNLSSNFESFGPIETFQDAGIGNSQNCFDSQHQINNTTYFQVQVIFKVEVFS